MWEKKEDSELLISFCLLCLFHFVSFYFHVQKCKSKVFYINFIVSQQHLTDMKATQTMSNEKLLAKGKAVTFEPDMYYSQVNTKV